MISTQQVNSGHSPEDFSARLRLQVNLEMQLALKGEILRQLELIAPNKAAVHSSDVDGPFNEVTFDELIDPSMQTIALSMDGMPYAGLIASAVQYRRAMGLQSPNVVIVNPTYDPKCLLFAQGDDGAATLFANRGMIIDSQAQVWEGTFPEPMPLSLISIPQSLEQLRLFLEGRNIPLLEEGFAALIANDKSLLPHISEMVECQIPASQVFRLDGFIDTDSRVIKDIMQYAEQFADGFVVKPVDSSQGTNVHLFERNDLKSDRDQISAALASIQLEHPIVLVQERINCFPTANAQIDWNVRILVSKFGVFGAEIRLGDMGKAVNKCQGAAIMSVNEFIRTFDPSEGVEVSNAMRLLEHQSVKVACALDAHCLGLDWIINSSATPYLIEINGERSGGLGSLAEIGLTRGEKLRAPSMFLENIQLAQPQTVPIKPFFLDSTFMANTGEQVYNAARQLIKRLLNSECDGLALDILSDLTDWKDDLPLEDILMDVFSCINPVREAQRCWPLVEVLFKNGSVFNEQSLFVALMVGETAIAENMATHLNDLFSHHGISLIDDDEQLSDLIDSGIFFKRISEISMYSWMDEALLALSQKRR